MSCQNSPTFVEESLANLSRKDDLKSRTNKHQTCTSVHVKTEPCVGAVPSTDGFEKPTLTSGLETTHTLNGVPPYSGLVEDPEINDQKKFV